MRSIALVTAIASAGQDDDLVPLLDACTDAGLVAQIRAWDDPSVGWNRYDAALLRSPWDYTQRLPQFLAWCERVSAQTRLINPLPVVRWNTDKHYLDDLARRGIPVVPTRFVEPDMEPLPALQAFLAEHAAAAEFVVKPSVGAGSKDAQRYSRSQEFAAANHLARLLDADRSAMLQPYLPAVDEHGETALLYFGGRFSHAIRKSALLRPDGADVPQPPTTEKIASRIPDADEVVLAETVLATAAEALSLAQPLTYARVDLIRDAAGQPCLLELELCEPSLFFAHATGSAERLALQLARTVSVRA